jgi:aminoglycoside phosphotransferase (APT) family kinase protein
MAALQVASVDHRADLLSAGLPDRGLAATLGALREVVAGSPELRLLDDTERAAVPTLLPHLERRFAEIAGWGLPETLVHGDLHLGNVANPGPDDALGLTIYDWTDACLAHPLVDLATLVRSSPETERDALVTAYTGVWRQHLDLPSIEVLVAAALDVERAHQAVTYERLQASLEEASRWEMEGVVARCLRRLLETMGS